MNILILGCGQLGQALALQLSPHHQVTVIARRERHFAEFQYFSHDFLQLETMQNQLSAHAFDYVFCIVSPDERTLSAYQRTYLEIARPIFQTLQNHNPKKVFFISSTRVYGENHGGIIDDDSLPDSTDPYGQMLRASELTWQAYWQEKLCIIRPSGLSLHHSERFMQQARQSTAIDAIHWTNRIHRHDVIGFLAYLTTLDATKIAESYLLSDLQPLPLHHILNHYRQQQGLPMLSVVESRSHTGKRIDAQRLQQSGYVLAYPRLLETLPCNPITI